MVEETGKTETDSGGRMTAKKWLGYISAARACRKDLLDDWRENVSYRAGKPFSRGGTGESRTPIDRVAVPEDWSRSKQKTAQLAYQVPRVIAMARRPEFEAAAPIVTAAINDKLNRECRASYVLDECLADVINASGLMVSVIGVDVRTEDRTVELPRMIVDPMSGQEMPHPEGPEKRTVTAQVSKRFFWRRISPALFLWPAEFTGSDWDQAPWLGYEYWMPFEEAKRQFELPADFKPESSKPESLAEDVTSGKQHKTPTTDYVKVTQIFYYGSVYDPDTIHPDCIKTIAFVEGHEEPVLDEPIDWQVWVPEQAATPPGPPTQDNPQGTPGSPAVPGHYHGITRLPIRVGTLVYVSDLATPPSDSTVGRAQVRELTRSRSQMLRQRDHSIPIRWFNVNMIDADVVEAIKAGTWQDMIPMDGPGDRAVGEVARANYPRENFEFQNVISGDLDRAWSLSNNQLSSLNDTERSATEINVMSNANAVRLDYEKGRVNRYLVETAEVLFQLMQKYLDETDYVRIVGEDGKDRLEPVTKELLAGDFAFEIKADSSDRVDLVTRQANATKLYNLLANSPTVNRQALEREILELHGFDPKRVEVQPKEPPPERPSVSYRFSGEDLLNPLVIAVLQKSGTVISPDDIKAAALLLKDSIQQMQIGQPPATMAPAGPAVGPPEPNVGEATVTPPDVNQPILKRTENGDRLAA